ncbi:hypothetical protein KIPB_016703, partial [Kipferlia bialata]|eukprot:g16703.t1
MRDRDTRDGCRGSYNQLVASLLPTPSQLIVQLSSLPPSAAPSSLLAIGRRTEQHGLPSLVLPRVAQGGCEIAGTLDPASAK